MMRACQGWLCVFSAIMVLLTLPPGVRAQLPLVTRSGSQLQAGGKPFYFIGANAYQLPGDASSTDNKWRVQTLLSHASNMGLRVLRTWGFNHNSPASAGFGSNSLTYDEGEMSGLDTVIQEAASSGIYVILAIGNLWPAFVGPEVFLSAAGETGDVLTFYQSSAAMALYKGHIQYLLGRVNTLTGIAYKDDPTILGWDVMNEPRCPGCPESDIWAHEQWLADMSSFTKEQTNQLVMIATEGFFGPYDPNVNSNPGFGSSCEGEDWTQENALSGVDVATMHMYWRQTEGLRPANLSAGLVWPRFTFSQYMSFVSTYLDLHIQLAADMGKPLLLEEFNIVTSWASFISPPAPFSDTERAALFSLVFEKLAASQANGGPFVGAMFWSATMDGADNDGYNVNIGDAQGSGPQPPNSENAPPASRRMLAERLNRSVSTSVMHGPVRHLLDEVSVEDPFRRVEQRQECAQTKADSWQLAVNLNTVDVSSYLGKDSDDPADVIAIWASRINSK